MTIYGLCIYTAVVLGLPYVAIMRSLRAGLFNMRPQSLRTGVLGWAFGPYADGINLYRVKAKPTGRSASIWIARILFTAFAALMILASFLSTLPMYGAGKLFGVYLN